MRYGIYLTVDTMRSWMWNDGTTASPGELPYETGARLVDLSELSSDDASMMIRLAYQLPPAERDAFLSNYPQIILAPVVAPGTGLLHVQPGFRRIVHRPTQDWHDLETLARIRANSRIKSGENEKAVIKEEFKHLDQKEKGVREGMLNGGLFPLTPMVRLVERKIILQDGSETVETLRQFPFYEPVAYF